MVQRSLLKNNRVHWTQIKELSSLQVMMLLPLESDLMSCEEITALAKPFHLEVTVTSRKWFSCLLVELLELPQYLMI